MSDYIKREDAITHITRFLCDEALKIGAKPHEQGVFGYIRKTINDIPAEDVEPVRHGHWIEKNTNKDGTHNIYCNKCGKYIKSKGHANSLRVRHELLYCPYCGTKMDE